jgi:hypothetical protein
VSCLVLATALGVITRSSRGLSFKKPDPFLSVEVGGDEIIVITADFRAV